MKRQAKVVQALDAPTRPPPGPEGVRYDEHGIPHADRGSKWTWDDRRRRALECVHAGWPKVQVARDVGIHRDTLHTWISHPEFQAKLAELRAETAEMIGARRAAETTQLNGRFVRLVDKALSQAEKKPNSAYRQTNLAFWLDKYLRLRGEERKDAGDGPHATVDHRVSGAVGVDVSGRVEVAAMHAVSFKQFLAGQAEKGVIDVDAVEGADVQDATVKLLQAAVAGGDLMDVLDEEDKQLKAARLRAASKTKTRAG